MKKVFFEAITNLSGGGNPSIVFKKGRFRVAGFIVTLNVAVELIQLISI